MIARCNHNYRVNQTSLYMHCPRTQESLSRLQSHIWSQEHPLHHLLVIAHWQLVVATRSPSSFGGTSLSRQVWSRERSCTSRTIQTSRSSWSTVSKYVTIIMNYCASLVVFASWKVNDIPHPVVLCVTDNTSALNWTLHKSKKSMIGRALKRFFCGLMIGSNVVVNEKWISTIKNVIADKISRLKKLIANNPNSPSSHTYDYANLQQEHKELKACSSFQPSHKLLSLIWEILLTQKFPDLSLILILKPQDLGKLST